MSVYSLHPITIGGVRTYALSSRKSKVTVADFAGPIPRQASLGKWFDSLPDILAAIDLHRLHKLSFWDALVVRAAQQAGCTVLYSEDMQNARQVDGLRIVNPFR